MSHTETRYRTEYQTRTVPVTRFVDEQIPVTQTHVEHRQEIRPQSVPVVRTKPEQVGVTEAHTHLETEYRTETVPVKKTVFEVVNVPRKVTNFTTRQETVIKDVTRIEIVPVTKTRTHVYYETVMKNGSADRVSAQDGHIKGSTGHHDLQDRDLHRKSAGDNLAPGGGGVRFL